MDEQSILSNIYFTEGGGVAATKECSLGEYVAQLKILSDLLGKDFSAVVDYRDNGMLVEIIFDSDFNFEDLLVKIYVLPRFEKGSSPFTLFSDIREYYRHIDEGDYREDLNLQLLKYNKYIKSYYDK